MLVMMMIELAGEEELLARDEKRSGEVADNDDAVVGDQK